MTTTFLGSADVTSLQNDDLDLVLDQDGSIKLSYSRKSYLMPPRTLLPSPSFSTWINLSPCKIPLDAPLAIPISAVARVKRKGGNPVKIDDLFHLFCRVDGGEERQTESWILPFEDKDEHVKRFPTMWSEGIERRFVISVFYFLFRLGTVKGVKNRGGSWNG